jgi:hypothetical protein
MLVLTVLVGPRTFAVALSLFNVIQLLQVVLFVFAVLRQVRHPAAALSGASAPSS